MRLINHLDRSRFEPVLVLMEKKGAYLDMIPEDVPVHVLGVNEENPLEMFKIVSRLRRVVRELTPQILFSMLWYANICAILAVKGLPTRSVISERIWTPYEISDGTVLKALRPIKKFLLEIFYRHADHVVAVSSGIAEELCKNFGVRKKRVSIIHNPVPILHLVEQSRSGENPWREEGFKIVSMGRLTAQKGHDHLIRALGKLPKETNFHLQILGEGPDEALLKGLVEECGLQGKVTLAGFVGNPFVYLVNADLFVLASRAEGFPNALVEAMCFSIPVIAADCPTGPSEILLGGEVAPLVPVDDVEKLSVALKRMMDDDFFRQGVVSRVEKRIQDFSASLILARYEDLFAALGQEKDSRTGRSQ
jgi:glycosyltransferase involved in cell wall biosynthesis